jgi:diguanylate cyclase
MFTAPDLLSPAFFSGIAFAALLLCAGLAIGIWLGRQESTKRREAEVSRQALQVVAGLSGWTASFASDVAHYRETIDLFSRRLTEFEKQPNPPAATMLMGHVNDANECLQRRIEAAEQTLQKQASDINSYLQEARTDALTGLPNRRSFDDEFQKRLAQWRRKRTPFSLLLLDVDRFKQLNDTYGHPAGDAVLSEVGRLLREHLEEGEMAARFGGEEFALLLPYDEEGSLAEVCCRLRNAITSCQVPFDDCELTVTISGGAAIAGDGELGPHLVKRADEALYAAKHKGRDCGYWHDGQGCVPLLGLEQSAVESGTEDACHLVLGVPAREAGVSAEFREVCTDLRRRLQELTFGSGAT